jgi:signal transduction histidine kinase
MSEVYDAALDALCQSQRCDRAAILLADDGGVMRFTAWRGLSENYRRAVEGHSPWPRDARDPQPVCLPNVAEAGLAPALQEVIAGEGIRALAFIPLTYEGRLLGKFMAYYDAPHAFGLDDVQAAQTIASQVAFGIARLQAAAHLEELVNSRTVSLQSALQQMEEFSYTVSHDLRAPARSMMSYIDVIKEDHGATLPPAVTEYLDRIHRNARRMDVLVRDTLAYSRAVRMDCALGRISLDEVVADAIAGLDTPAKRAAITVHGPLGDVVGNELCLAQAISNLLDNGLKFVAPGVAPRIAIRALPRGNRLRLQVQDNGLGIPGVLQPRLFRMFERLHQAGYEGTGIGLAIVRKVVERMNGSVGVDSDGCNGSTFWIEVERAS